jgi:hypothetical protein
MERMTAKDDPLKEKYKKYFNLKIYQGYDDPTIKSSKKSFGFTPTEILGTLQRMCYQLNKMIDEKEEE